MNKELIVELFASAETLLSTLRLGEPLIDQQFQSLCDVLKQCTKEWENMDFIPKIAFGLLVDLPGAIEDSVSFYKNGEAEKVMDWYVTIHALVVDSASLDLEAFNLYMEQG